ncbi:hypothetical protein V4C53_42010 [Paraburkholderia azotifigens]|uniref:hypothetical protein n=1 Tax=Paraburkholderia azotifigens TaxID=2057004 RepID=UPI00316F1C4D
MIFFSPAAGVRLFSLRADVRAVRVFATAFFIFAALARICDFVARIRGFVARIREFVSVLQALPLCGAALTFFAAAKKVREGLNNPFSAWDL